MSAPLPTNENRGPSIIASQCTTVSIASFLVFLRLFTRAFIRKMAGADDWTIVIALGFALAQSILTTFQVDSGFGRHIEHLQPDQISNVLLLTTVLEVLYIIGTFLVRVSVCLSILRLVPPTHREFYRHTYILIAFFAVISTAAFLLILLACVPVQGFAAFMDFLCVGLPIFFLRNLDVKTGRKICLFVLLGLGLFTVACAILRTLTISFANEDITWHDAPVALWACLEQNVGIIVASIPGVHQLYTIVLQKYFPDFGNNLPHLRSLQIRASSGNTATSEGSHNEKIWLRSRGSQSMRMMSSADGSGGGTILPGPESPTKKEPRLDYDSPTLVVSPKLERAATTDEAAYLES